MSAPRLAWALWGVAAMLVTAEMFFAIQNGGREGGGVFGAVVDTLFRLGLLVFPTVGAFVASRRPKNPIGWIMLGTGISLALSGFALSYATYGLFTRPGGVPAADVMAWISGWIYLPSIFATPPLLFLLFPDGRLLGPRWRAALALVVFSTVALTTAIGLAPGTLQEAQFEQIANPFGVDGAEVTIEIIFTIGWIAGLSGIVVGSVSMLVRLRRSRGVERQQLKWIAGAAALFAASALTAYPIFGDVLGQIITLGAFGSIPIAAGIAILRYRLYDIDVIIRRTLVYGALTLVLGAAYVGSVLGLQALLSPFTANNGPAVAVSTLAVAALFGPVRRRTQGVVDRRFYRSRYDAQRILEAFASRLRDEVDIDSLADALRDATHSTVRPASASVWLRIGRQ
ncbi:MAG: hypothetical protein ABIO99_07145 [Candidatus Limnocylindria bacterium]